MRTLILVVLLAAGLSSCSPVDIDPAEAAKAWGSWEKAMEAINRHIAEGMTPTEAMREAAKGPKGKEES